MLRTIWTSKTGLDANQDKLDAISNNIANSTTTGYKKEKVGFKDLLNETLNRKGYPLNDKTADMGTGVRTTNWYEQDTQGNLTQTGRSTDLCIDGETTYFRLTTPDGGKVYTRDGSFEIDSNGKLVDTNGNMLDIEYMNGHTADNTVLTTDNLNVDSEGYIYSKENGQDNLIGKINLYTSTGSQPFVSTGNNLYVPAQGSGVQQSTTAQIHQGYLEASNVDISQEFTDMIVTQRAFQLSSKALQTADDMWGMVNNMRR